MTFKNAVLNTTTEARTENGMKALRSSLRNTTDLFYKFGASRGKDITQLFEKAYHEDREIALRLVQWGRDVRGGAGERALFLQILSFLEKNYKDDLLNTQIMSNIPEIGRWDDLLVFTDTDVRAKAFAMIKQALDSGNGLAAKWMPRKGKKYNTFAYELRNAFGWSPKFYRKRLAELSKVVETQMCAKDWEGINFSHVPSLAMSRYSKAFGRNAPDAFAQFKTALKKGDPSVKVNAGAVYPYDIVKNVRRGDSDLADEQWKALPNYVGDAMVLPLVDTSGSMGQWGYGSPLRAKGMTVTPMDIALSLGLYCAEKNTGPFKDLFLTFSESPKFQHVKGTLSQKIRQMETAAWGMNTDLHKAFDEILRVATTNRVSPSDMPQVLLILSDMQFDACRGYDNSAIEMIRRKYTNAGYNPPAVVFWNLNGSDNVPVRFDERGTALVSGFSPSIVKSVLEGNMESMTPEAIMLKTVASDRYNI